MLFFRSISISVLLLSGCITGEQFGDEKPSMPLVSDGYRCTTTPSTAYSPGYVFRIDSSGSSFLVQDAREQAETVVYAAALGSYDASLSSSGSLDFSILGADSPFKANVGTSSTATSKVTFRNGQFVVMSDASEAALKAKVIGSITPRSGSQYFIVRDSIQANGIEININSQDQMKLGGEAEVSGLISAKPGFELSKVNGLKVSGDFETPLNVCVRAVSLDLEGSDTLTDGPVAVSEGQPIRVLQPEVLAEVLENLD